MNFITISEIKNLWGSAQIIAKVRSKRTMGEFIFFEAEDQTGIIIMKASEERMDRSLYSRMREIQAGETLIFSGYSEKRNPHISQLEIWGFNRIH